MARTIKIDNATEKRFARASKKKKTNRTIKVSFLIVCEGEKTEPNYFKAFPNKNSIFDVIDIDCEGSGKINTLGVVEKAIKLREEKDYDSVWAVFDKDSFESVSFNNAIAKAKANEIKCAWSNEAFEIWYVLHFHSRITSMPRTEHRKALEKFINQELEKKKITTPFKYEKNSKDMYALLNEHGNQAQAIKRAKELCQSYDNEKFAEHNPCTTVHLLVEELLGKSEELNNKISEKYGEKEAK